MARGDVLARDPGVAGSPAPGRDPGPLGVLSERVRPQDLSQDRRLPVLPAFDALLPGAGLRRGTAVAVEAAPGVQGATALALALAAGPSRAGAWVAVVGLPSLGLVAAAEMGVALERVVAVDPGGDPTGGAQVVAALVDGFDVVVVPAGLTVASDAGVDLGGGGAGSGGVGSGGPALGRPGGGGGVGSGGPALGRPGGGGGVGGAGAGEAGGAGGSGGPGIGGVGPAPRRRRLRPADGRRLVARVRERGSVLVTVGGDLPGERSHVRLTVTAAAWEGLGAGWGYLQSRWLAVEAGGRGESARPRRAELWLPGGDGLVAAVEPLAVPIPLRREPAVPTPVVAP